MDKYSLKDYYLWKLQGDKVFLLDIDGEIAGIVDLVEEDEYILVDMLAKNKIVNAEKVGSRLLEFSEEYARIKGKKFVVVEALDTAKGFYEKLGFKEISKKYDKEWGILTVMVKEVVPTTQLNLSEGNINKNELLAIQK
ncbi:GNAT family N-acetyltransferase [Acidianus sulfidivorans JP7]|uniref:N-acetyltransferase domain-containing protein n=2 Tax=Acidianus TaxID=12914 RepID=A0A2U9IN76_9CREN|nr:GNAT family N-acetyltransferase [Acidianus sulfidivorans]AWR97456.1 GNAT family N-acetyltransferase [Acidianus sulfidivorans JP7]